MCLLNGSWLTNPESFYTTGAIKHHRKSKHPVSEGQWRLTSQPLRALIYFREFLSKLYNIKFTFTLLLYTDKIRLDLESLNEQQKLIVICFSRGCYLGVSAELQTVSLYMKL